MWADWELSPVAPTSADDDNDQTQRQVDRDDLADRVEMGAGERPVLFINGAPVCRPYSIKQETNRTIISQPMVCMM